MTGPSTARVLVTPGTTKPASVSSRPRGYWGMVMLIVTEGTVFLGLVSAYFFIRASSPEWPQGGIAPPELRLISVYTVVLLASSIPVVVGERMIVRGSVRGLRIGLLVSFLMGLVFVVNQGKEFASLEFGVKDNAYASLFIVITGLHGLHLVVGLLMSIVVQIKAARGWFSAERHLTVTVFGMYWHFVDAVWVVVFSSLYLGAHWR